MRVRFGFNLFGFWSHVIGSNIDRIRSRMVIESRLNKILFDKIR